MLPCIHIHFASLTHVHSRTRLLPPLQAGPVALEMYSALTDIQTEKADDKFGWVYPVK